MQSKKTKRKWLLIVFIMLIYGIYLMYDWNYIHQEFYKEGDTLEEISLEELSDTIYVSFYIDDYVNKETYVHDNVEYEIYTILLERKTNENEALYIQVMVKNQETKEKLKNLEQDKVYFQGEVISATDGRLRIYEGSNIWTDILTDKVDYYGMGKLIVNMGIIETELPDEGYGLYIGIALVIFALVGYRMLGGIKGCLPDIETKPGKFTDYSFEYSTQTYNIRNDWLCEKNTLKKLQAEQIENKKICNIMTVVFLAGLLIYIKVPMIVIRILSCIPMYLGIGGIWSRFINSSNELAVYIAKSRGKRSIYIEIEECKKNIELLEKVMEEKNKE